VVLDLMLPGIDGLEVCKQIQRDRHVPVLMLTARDEEADLLVGLGVGADDYMTKPFSMQELVARLRAPLRRALYPHTRRRCVSNTTPPPAATATSPARGSCPWQYTSSPFPTHRVHAAWKASARSRCLARSLGTACHATLGRRPSPTARRDTAYRGSPLPPSSSSTAALTARLDSTDPSGRLTRTQPSGRTANWVEAIASALSSPSAT